MGKYKSPAEELQSREQPSYTLKQLVFYFLKLGTIGFGGPPALVSYMHRDLVEKRKWIKDEDYKEGMALSQLAPGPLAAQLSIYLGYVHYRLTGSTLAGIAFVLPSFIMVLALGYFYVAYGGLAWVQGLFYGIGAAVIGIIAAGTYKLSRKSLSKELLLWLIFIALAISTFILEQEIISLILFAGLLYWFVKMKKGPISQLSIAPFLLQAYVNFSNDDVLKQIGWFFFKAGAFVFGSGLAIVPFLYGGVVKEYGWLNEQQFLDAVAVAMITPGPVVITVGFIGYLTAGLPGATIAALATFLPCYIFTVVPAPYFKKWGKHAGVKAFIDGVTAAAIGAIAGAVLVLTKRQITDIPSALIAITTCAALLRYKNLKEPLIILIAGVLGLLIK